MPNGTERQTEPHKYGVDNQIFLDQSYLLQAETLLLCILVKEITIKSHIKIATHPYKGSGEKTTKTNNIGQK